MKLQVIVKGGPSPNVTYIATLTPAITDSSAARLQVVVFYCNGVAVGKAEFDKTGKAIFRLNQEPGKYQAQAAIPNGPRPMKSNVVVYAVPKGLV